MSLARDVVEFRSLVGWLVASIGDSAISTDDRPAEAHPLPGHGARTYIRRCFLGSRWGDPVTPGLHSIRKRLPPQVVSPDSSWTDAIARPTCADHESGNDNFR